MRLDIIGISQAEHDLVVSAAAKYGPTFVHTHDLVVFSWDFIEKVKPDAFAFALLISQFQKSITLSLLSALRNHEVQFSLMMRQALEAAALANYALHNPKIDDFGKSNEDDCLITNRDVSGKAYKWLQEEYPDHSRSMKYMKDQINSSYAHASILPASDNLQYGLNSIGSLFFDKSDDLFTQQHLWWVGNVVFGALDLFGKTVMKYPRVKLVPAFQENIKRFGQENAKIKTELESNPRFSRWISKV